jgi:hypothetical protein
MPEESEKAKAEERWVQEKLADFSPQVVRRFTPWEDIKTLIRVWKQVKEYEERHRQEKGQQSRPPESPAPGI